MHPCVQSLRELYLKVADPQLAERQKAYLQNKFSHFGITTPDRRKINKLYFNHFRPPYAELPGIIHELYSMEERELHQAAIELAICYRKEWDLAFLPTIEWMICHQSWWDSVDHIAVELAGPFFLQYPGKMLSVAKKWNRSKKMWLERTSVIFQLHYKWDTNQKLLFDNVRNLATSKEFFIRKAIGWALREYAKIRPGIVEQFVRDTTLSPLSEKEAMKHF